ncbi:MAG: hypothetical protein R3C03_20430 [Pirellulaceae bacterium]
MTYVAQVDEFDEKVADKFLNSIKYSEPATEEPQQNNTDKSNGDGI